MFIIPIQLFVSLQVCYFFILIKQLFFSKNYILSQLIIFLKSNFLIFYEDFIILIIIFYTFSLLQVDYSLPIFSFFNHYLFFSQLSFEFISLLLIIVLEC